MLFKTFIEFYEMGYGNEVLLKKNACQKFYGNYFPKYVLPKIFNVIPEKV